MGSNPTLSPSRTGETESDQSPDGIGVTAPETGRAPMPGKVGGGKAWPSCAQRYASDGEWPRLPFRIPPQVSSPG